MEQTIDAEYTIPSVALTNREDQRIIEWRQEIGKLLCYANAAEVKDLDTAREATNDLTAIASLDREIEGVRKDIKAPILEAGRVVDSFFNRLTEDLKSAKSTYDRKMAAYHAEQERIRKEAEAINKAVEAEVVEVPDQQKHVRAETGTVTFMAQVDKEAVDKAIAANLPDLAMPTMSIPGIAIWFEPRWKVLDIKKVPDQFKKVGTRVNGIGR
jgi:MarR-like DNA-binding transcriptional regulator SgrR of sgrS sRNA